MAISTNAGVLLAQISKRRSDSFGRLTELVFRKQYIARPF